MDKRDALRKELESMAEKQKALERELAMMDEKEKEKESGNKNRGIDFSGLHVWLRNYSFDNHFMKDREGKEDYIRLLILTALMMQPYTEHLDEGLAFIEQVQNVLGGQGVEELMTEVMEIDRKSMEKVIASVLKNQGAQSFLIDSLLLYGEMKKGEDKAEVTRQLSSLYGLLGADEKLIAEAADAVDFIEKGDREGLQKAVETWEELQPALALAYLGVAYEEKKIKTSYTAAWPKRLDTVDASVCPTYANNVILKTMVNEGDAVGEGDILYILYGGKREEDRASTFLREDFTKGSFFFKPISDAFGSDVFKNMEDVFRAGRQNYWENEVGYEFHFGREIYQKEKGWMYLGEDGESEENAPVLGIDENYEKIVVKAECNGIVHYGEDISVQPFQDGPDKWKSDDGDPHVRALMSSTDQPPISRDEYFRSGSLLKLDNISSSVICTITPVK